MDTAKTFTATSSLLSKNWSIDSAPGPLIKNGLPNGLEMRLSPEASFQGTESTETSDNQDQPTKSQSGGLIVDRGMPNTAAVDPKSFDDSAGTLSVQNTAKMSSENQLGAIMNQTPDQDSNVLRTEAEPVRFVLPKDLHSAGVKNGQTIILKMEPEHLGNIRLTLSTHQDSVTGRLVVDNAAARSAVQSNLDNLFDQLSRQGIKLDHFEVSLGGGQSGYKFAQSRTAGEMKGQSRWKKNMENNAVTLSVSNTSGRSRMYIGAAGVNWIA